MSTIFITATGTDVGKTFVAEGLIRHFRAAGRQVEALKPVATGFDISFVSSSDPGILLRTLGRPLTIAELDRISPWRFAAPLSPDMAAKRENASVDFAKLVAFCRAAIARSENLLIEGIGGVMVPLDDSHTVLDLMAALNSSVLLVTGSYLGTLSHTLTALDTLRRRDLVPKAVVVNETLGSSVPMPDTIATLSHFAASDRVIALPRAPAVEAQIFANIAACCEA
jgi:dethiobiotin synthetase